MTPDARAALAWIDAKILEARSLKVDSVPVFETIRQALTQMIEGGWNSDMEAAPRDGTRVQLFFCGKQCVARTEHNPLQGPQWVIYGEMGKPDCWVLADKPTHWKHLSPPPTGEQS